MDATSLGGKVVLVTGAGSGIGREIALECARRGADLALCDVDARGLAETVEAAGPSRRVVFDEVDVSDAAAMEGFAGIVHDRFGAVDLLVNNAGIGLVASFLETSPEDWRRLVDINVLGVVNGCRLFVPRMIELRRHGHVVNLASAAGVQANPALSAYSTTKFAVFGLSEALRTELREHGIGVTAVCPGLINTPITRTSPIRGERADERRERLAKLYERRGYGADRVARAVLKAVDRDTAVAPVAAEAHLAYALSRVAPPLSRWIAGRMAAAAK
jgi:NAD(P)-dependent dehydrogenase (short-subunit alcohol dehydrogenase family)